MALTRPVIAFALLKQCSEVMRTDLLGGISILIRPLITDLGGQRFSSSILADRLAATYGISIGPEVLEEFLPRFRDAGIVEIRPLSPNAEEALRALLADGRRDRAGRLCRDARAWRNVRPRAEDGANPRR